MTGFSRKVKEKLLVDSKRCCCLCESHKGRNVEVHHIVQPSEGGSHDADNGIVLCYECHAEVKHYNPNHPKGNKYSASELKQRRDAWTEKANRVLLDNSFMGYEFRHLVSDNYESVSAIIDMDDSNLPFNFNYLMNNKILKHMNKVLNQKSISPLGVYKVEEYASWEDFHSKNPEFGGNKRRLLSNNEFGMDGVVKAPLIEQLVRNGHSASNFCYIQAYEDGCDMDDVPIVTEVITSPTYFVFAQLKNTFDKPISLNELIVRKNNQEFQFFGHEKIFSGNNDFPPISEQCANNILIGPSESLLIPEGMFLLSTQNSLESRDENDAHGTVNLSSVELQEYILSLDFKLFDNGTRVYWLSPFSLIEEVCLRVDNKLHQESIWPFNPQRFYKLDRHWQIGCCPHLYLYYPESGWKYWGEVFVRSNSNYINSEVVHIPKNVTKIHIAETNYETAFFQEICFNGFALLNKATVLTRGQSLEFAVSGPGILTMAGRYEAPIMKPANYLHILQTAKLRHVYEKRLLR